MVIQTLVLLDILSKIKQARLLFQGLFLLLNFKVKIKILKILHLLLYTSHLPKTLNSFLIELTLSGFSS